MRCFIIFGYMNAVQEYRHIKINFGELKLVGGLWVHICTRNVDVFSDFDQNEANFLIRYHKYNAITVPNLT